MISLCNMGQPVFVSLNTIVRCRQQEQRELRKQRKRLRDICAVEDHGEELYDIMDVEELCAALTRVQLSDLCDKVQAETCDDAKRTALNNALNLVYLSKGEVCLLAPFRPGSHRSFFTLVLAHFTIVLIRV